MVGECNTGESRQIRLDKLLKASIGFWYTSAYDISMPATELRFEMPSNSLAGDYFLKPYCQISQCLGRLDHVTTRAGRDFPQFPTVYIHSSGTGRQVNQNSHLNQSLYMHLAHANTRNIPMI